MAAYNCLHDCIKKCRESHTTGYGRDVLKAKIAEGGNKNATLSRSKLIKKLKEDCNCSGWFPSRECRTFGYEDKILHDRIIRCNNKKKADEIVAKSRYSSDMARTWIAAEQKGRLRRLREQNLKADLFRGRRREEHPLPPPPGYGDEINYA